MTVYRASGRLIYRYDFRFMGRRYSGSTRQTLKDAAQLVESDLKRRLREQAGQLPTSPGHTPRFQDWAEIYYAHASKTLQRPEHVEVLLRVALRFWGAGGHDLRLEDPIRDPEWIERFEAWLTVRGLGPQSKNHYRSVLSRMYRCALLPQHRKAAGVTMNPFLGVPRDPTVARDVTLTVRQLRAWLTQAPPHARLALALAALAPKLRLKNILDLRWTEHFDGALTRITIATHKTARQTKRPLVVPIVPVLRTMLKAARLTRSCEAVIAYRGKPLTDIRGALETSAAAAGLTYGRTHNGVTFHTVRHTMATLLAELGEPESVRKAIMGHTMIETTQRYTHLRPEHELAPMSRLAQRIGLGSVCGKTCGTRTGGRRIAGKAPHRAGQ